MSRANKVIDYLHENRVITSMKIIKMMDATSPSKVISEVRRKLALNGLDLCDSWERNENTGSRYKIYWIGEQS